MARQKILIVDDEAGMRELLDDLLADMNCDLVFAADGKEGLEKAIGEKPDLMLLDIMLPGMDGFQLCQTIRSRADTSGIPVIMMTGHSTEDSARKGIEIGAEDVLAKPFNMSELKLRVRTVLQLNRYRLMAAERAQFKWVVENAKAGYIMLDKADKVQYINPKAQVYLGLDPEQSYMGASFDEITENGFERVSDTAWAQWPEPQEQCFLIRPETATSHAFWLRVDVVPEEEHTEQRIIRLNDVTDEMMMFQNMWKFEHMVSHKLRTPLTGLIGSLDGLESSMEKIEDEDCREMIREASEAAQRLHDSIRGVIEHMNSRKHDEHSGEEITLGKLENFLNQLAMTNGVEQVNIELDPALSMRGLRLGAEEALQIIQEFYDNSIKFHPEQKPRMEVTLREKDARLATMTVSDDGRSHDSQTLDKIGTPFYQVEKHFTGEVPGMGLGLSMLHTMLTSRGGGMRVKNAEPGPGITIELDIPFSETS